MADGTTINDANDANGRPHNAPRGLTCGACGHARLKVVYTRPAPGGRIVRRRECKRCEKRVTTWERMIGQLQMCNNGSADSDN